jgi:hypothetical protein
MLVAVACERTTAQTATADPAPDLVLSGDVTGAQSKTYFEVPFKVPSGKHRISVDFRYTAREQRSVLDLGIADPMRFRGASGGNKSHFTISETDATPSYLPGAIVPGTWRLLISVPNMRPHVVSHYTAEIRFDARSEETGFADRPLAISKRWYRGDLHMHTAHSDGSCLSQSGREVPCPLFLTVQTAAARGLDFIAITDHNTDSQFDDIRELQPVYGVTQFIDWRVSPGRHSLNEVLRDALAKGGLASVNHAQAPEGEDCMGCGWAPAADADMGLFSAVEVINYGVIMFSSANYWDSQLREGHRLAAVGGSDNHNATTPPGEPGSIGWPTTVIEADELSVAAILSGIRSGRTFVDLTASRDKTVDFSAASGGASARMGETLQVAENAKIQVNIHAVAVPGSTAHLYVDGVESSATPTMHLEGADADVTTTLTAAPGRHWLRVVVRDDAEKDQLISSPLYINFAGK